MRRRIGLVSVVLALLPIVVACGGSSPPPVYVPEACQVPLLLAGAAISTEAHADGGVSRDERNKAIDELAACLKAIP